MQTTLRPMAIASVRIRTPCLVLALLLSHGSVAQAQELLLLTFANGMSSDTTHSTQAVTSLTIVDGRQVVLARSEGTDYQTRSSGGPWSWTQVQQVPLDATHLTVTPTRQGDDVLLDIQFSSRKGDEATLYSSTVRGGLGQWIPLLQASETADSTGGNHYSTATQRQNLAVKVEPAESR